MKWHTNTQIICFNSRDQFYHPLTTVKTFEKFEFFRPDLIDRLVVVSSSPVNTDARFQEWQNLIQSFYVIQTLKANFDSKKPVAGIYFMI